MTEKELEVLASIHKVLEEISADLCEVCKRNSATHERPQFIKGQPKNIPVCDSCDPPVKLPVSKTMPVVFLHDNPECGAVFEGACPECGQVVRFTDGQWWESFCGCDLETNNQWSMTLQATRV